jgi:Protein of unknown function (DUF3619)
MTTVQLSMDTDLRVSRLGARLAAHLSEQSATLPHDISERLRVSREQAGARARLARRQAATAAAVLTLPGGVALLGGPPVWWQRLASTLPLVLLVAGLLLIDQWTTREQVLAAADIDTVLLSDDLPPNAYADPGFGEFLKSPLP